MLNLEIIGQGATTTIYRDGDKAVKLYVNSPPNEAQKIKQTPHISKPRKSQLLILLEQLNFDSINLCHGDFHPLNILYDESEFSSV